MDRGISTVLDVGLACLLVTASATLLVTTPTTAPALPDADRIGRVILTSTVAIDSTGQTVETSVGDVIVSAASGGTIAPKIRSRVEERVREIHRRTSVAASVAGGTPVEFGPEPAPGVAVDAAVFRVGPSGTAGSVDASTGSVVIVVRTWSP